MGKLVRRSIVAMLLLVACAALGQAQGPKQGERLFMEEANPPCALCHTLKAAGSTGTIGPDLDELKPDQDRVSRAVKNGVGAMPPYGETLSDAEIAALSEYVAKESAASK